MYMVCAYVCVVRTVRKSLLDHMMSAKCKVLLDSSQLISKQWAQNDIRPFLLLSPWYAERHPLQ